jgi:hypothetical protein
MASIPINLAVEDLLSEAVLRKILQYTERPYDVGTCFCRGGYGYLKKNIHGFNNAAKAMPFLVLTDLDKAECPAVLIKEWLPHPKHPNLLFRVAVKEVEAWLLAHRDAFTRFLGIQRRLIPSTVDVISDPKKLLLDLARKSKRRLLREAIVPSPGSTARVGPDYNGQLVFFVEAFWNVATAMQSSPSLKRTVVALTNFQPRWDERQNTS